MAKYKTIGSVMKSKDFATTKETYIKIKEDVTLKAGSFVSLVNPRTLATKLAGKVSDEVLAKIAERGEKTPDFVMFELQIKNDE
jgi:hypothetical protein